ncbi:MAG: hypothetical protein V5804_05420 [Mucilaginibacter sp.]|uniref:hypothetical protein n=1 Tax=Mucilaginibacter sp. TaxID=1882438 RepID=UPI0034E4BB76
MGLKIEVFVFVELSGPFAGSRPGAVGGMPPGGDPAFLISLVLFYQEKRTDKKKIVCKIHHHKAQTQNNFTNFYPIKEASVFKTKMV